MKKTILLLGILFSIYHHHVKAQENTYRPFVEEGKVWKVGWIPSGSDAGNVAQAIAYFWLEEVVDSATCAWLERVNNITNCMKLMREYVCNEDCRDIFPAGTQECFDIFEDLKAHEVLGGYVTKNPDGWLYYLRSELLYSFDYNGALFDYMIGDLYYSAYIRDVRRGSYTNGFKGLISTVVSEYINVEVDEPYYYEFETIWLEGIGSEYGPYPNIFDPTYTDIEWFLMECRVGDEILYYNPNIIDGVNPPDEETKKRIDFTHVTKPKPKAPHKADAANDVQFSGAYTKSLLDLELGSMSDTYHVTITDGTGETVYDKDVHAIDVLALNIDISEWTAPSYTITVENDYEQYVGTFSPTPTSISLPPTPSQIEKDEIIYDLQGRRVTTPTKGLYIKNGKKYLKR